MHLVDADPSITTCDHRPTVQQLETTEAHIYSNEQKQNILLEVHSFVDNKAFERGAVGLKISNIVSVSRSRVAL